MIYDLPTVAEVPQSRFISLLNDGLCRRVGLDVGLGEVILCG